MEASVKRHRAAYFQSKGAAGSAQPAPVAMPNMVDVVNKLAGVAELLAALTAGQPEPRS